MHPPACSCRSAVRLRVAPAAACARSRPVAGKTHDLAWLATHSGAKEVVGVEFVQQALEEFAKEHAELKLKKCVRSTRRRGAPSNQSPAHSASRAAAC